MWDFFQQHQTAAALIAYWVASNVVTSLPSPTQDSSGFYKFFFTLSHGLAGSLSRVFPALRLPNVPSDSTPIDQQTFFAKKTDVPEDPKPKGD